MKFKSSLRNFLTIAGSSLLVLSSASAQSGTWTQTTASTTGAPHLWTDTANWDSGTIADAQNNTASFTPNIAGNQFVDLNGVARTIGNITFTDSVTSNGNLTIQGSTLILDRSAGVPIIDVTQAARTLTISSVIDGLVGLQKDGAGILVLSGTNSYSGGTIINAGTLSALLQANLGGGLVTINATGTLTVGTGAYTNNMTLNGGTLDIRSNGFNGGPISGTITLTANSTISSTNTNSGVAKISGPMTGAGGFTKTGNGGLQLNGANDYAGPTLVSGTSGASGLTVKSSLYGNDTTKWTPANITVSSGNAFVLNVGGAGEFSMAQAATMFTQLATGVNNNGLRAGSIIGVDTRNAAAGTYVYSAVIADSTGTGGGSVGFKHTGDVGRVVQLTGANTYSGATIVENNGTLMVSSFNSVGTGDGYAPMANSSLGAPTTVANGTIHFGAANPISNVGNTFRGASITYTGNGETTDRVLSFNGGGNDSYTIDQSGAGLLKFVSNVEYVDKRGTKTLNLQGSTSGTGEFAGVIPNTTSNTMRIVKSGTGTWTLSGANAYTGTTVVSGGKLLINGSTTTLSAVSVSGSGTTLGGTGTIGGTVSIAANAILSPGASIESLASGALTMASGSTFAYEAANNSATGADLQAVNGTLSLTNVTLSLDLTTLAALAGGGWTVGNTLTLISYEGTAITSGFAGYDDDTNYSFGSNVWTFNYNDDAAGNNFGVDAIADGQTNFVTLTAFTVVPEPSTALLGAIGMIALLRRRR